MLIGKIHTLVLLLTTVALSLIAPCYGLSTEVLVGEAFDITPDLPSLSGQYNPRVAFDGTDTYLVAWEEGADVWQNTKKSIYAARIRVSGGVVRVLDPAAILLSNSANTQKRPRVAFGGGVFLVVWQELSENTDYDIRGARVTPDGQILDPEGISISAGPHNQVTPDVTYDGTHKKFFVVWADFRDRANYQIYGARIDIDGSIIDRAGIYLGGGGNSVPHTPVVATNGSQFLVVWTNVMNKIHYYRIRAGIYTLDGSLLGKAFSDQKILPGKHKIPGKIPPVSGVASNRSDFLVLSSLIYDTHCKFRPLAAFRVCPDGAVLNQKHPLAADRYEKTFCASLTFCGEFYFVVWEGISSNNRKAFLNPNHDLFATRLDNKVETALDYYNPIIIANTPAAELNPAIAKGNDSEILIVYEEDNLLDHPLGNHVIKGRVASIRPPLH